MRRIAVFAASLAALMGGVAPAALARTDDAAKPVVFLTGGEQVNNCKERFDLLEARLKTIKLGTEDKPIRFTGAFTTVTSYDADANCDVTLPGGASRGLDAQAKDFATWLRNTYSSKGTTVDVVAHGTGGVVLRYALAQAAVKAPGWPTPLLVEDAVTLGSPHSGSKALGAACPGRPICDDLNPDSVAGKAIVAKLATPEFVNPQGAGGTDWTAIGVAKDELISPESALGLSAAHETMFQDTKLTHTSMLHDMSEDNDATVTWQHTGTAIVEWRKAPHVLVRVGTNLVYGANGQLDAPTNQPDGCTGSNDAAGGATIVRNPGLEAWLGTNAADLSYIKSGILEAYALCFKQQGKLLASDGPVRMNGLDILPAPGTKVTIDPVTRTVKASKMTMLLPSKWFGSLPVRLMRDTALDWTLPKEAGPLTGGDLDGFKLSADASLFGRKFKGGLKLGMGQGTTTLETTLALPGYFQGTVPAGGAAQCGNGIDDDKDGDTDLADDNCTSANDNYEDSADNPGFAVNLKSENVKGLVVDKLQLNIEGNVSLGGFKLPSASLYYSPADNIAGAQVSAVIPWLTKPKITAMLELKDWSVSKFSVEGDGLGIPIPSTPLLIQRLKFGLAWDPFVITAGGAISVGPRSPITGKAGVEFDGEAEGAGKAWKFAGALKLNGDEWGKLNVETKETGFTIGGEIGRDDKIQTALLEAKYALKTKVSGSVDDDGVDINGEGRACFEGKLSLFGYYEHKQENTCLGESKLRVSSKKGQVAFTVCGNVDLGVAYTGSFGWGVKSLPNGTKQLTVIEDSCDVDAFHAAPASASQAGADRSLSIGSGLPAAVIGVVGQGGVPHVALRGPNGAVVPAPASASGIVKGDGYMLIHSSADNTTYAIIAKPAAGRWTVEPQADSAPIHEIKSADVRPAPRVKASVKRARGGRLKLAYDVKPREGQVVTFREVSPSVTKTLGRARGAHGSLTFRPSFGRGGKRRIVAHVEQNGLPRTELDVASFRAAAPRTLKAPRGVKLVRRGERLTATWKRVAGAVGYSVDVETADHRAIHYDVKSRRVVVKRMFDPRASRVTVRAVRADEKLGRAKTVRGGKLR
jgi:hypothetical protein